MAFKPGNKYALYAEIDQFIGEARKKGVTKAQIREFIQFVKQQSQSNLAPHRDTGYLENSWYSEETKDGEFVFGYSAEYAMPMDYNTEFFTGAINIARQKFGRQWGVDGLEVIREVEPSTLPGEFD